MKTEPVCTRCDDTHKMPFGEERRLVACTSCPLPCRKCASNNGRGAFCEETPCACDCHPRSVARHAPTLEVAEHKCVCDGCDANSVYCFKCAKTVFDRSARVAELEALVAEREKTIKELAVRGAAVELLGPIPATPSPAGGLDDRIESAWQLAVTKQNGPVHDPRERMCFEVGYRAGVAVFTPDQSERVAELERRVEVLRAGCLASGKIEQERDSLRQALTEREATVSLLERELTIWKDTARAVERERDEARREVESLKRQLVEMGTATSKSYARLEEELLAVARKREAVSSELSAAQERLAAWEATREDGERLARVVSNNGDCPRFYDVAERFAARLAALPKPSPVQGEHPKKCEAIVGWAPCRLDAGHDGDCNPEPSEEQAAALSPDSRIAEFQAAAPDASSHLARVTCKVCGNLADSEGYIEHSKACFQVSDQGGGTSYHEEADVSAVPDAAAPEHKTRL